jgi:hypothetical protein
MAIEDVQKPALSGGCKPAPNLMIGLIGLVVSSLNLHRYRYSTPVRIFVEI